MITHFMYLFTTENRVSAKSLRFCDLMTSIPYQLWKDFIFLHNSSTGRFSISRIYKSDYTEQIFCDQRHNRIQIDLSG